MTNEEAKKIIKQFRDRQGNSSDDIEAFDMAIKSLRYRPIILQEHDAEPRRMRAILDTKTEEIYVYKLTRKDAELFRMTIEEDENDK